jgi:hypothetical protein
MNFTSHAASPSYIYMLGKRLFSKVADTFLLHIKGYQFEFMSGMTKEAEQNLNEALKHIQSIYLQDGDLYDIAVVNERSTLS